MHALLQHGSCALDEQGSQVRIATLADAKQLLFTAGRVLARHKACPGGEVTSLSKSASVPDRCHDCRCGHRTHSGNGLHALAAFVFAGGLSDDAIHFSDSLSKLAKFDAELGQQHSQGTGEPQLSILQNPRQLLIDELPSFAQDDPAFQQQTSNPKGRSPGFAGVAVEL
jgi:hypothetical protein